MKAEMKPGSAKLLLIAVFIARGTSFIFSKTLMNNMSPLSVLAVRFIIAFLVLAIIFNKKLRECTRASLYGGIFLGICYTICMFFEMYGLRTIDTGVASFIENMAIILVPIYVAILTRVLPQKKTILCACIAVAGVGCLSLTQSSAGGGLNPGMLFTICAALTYGICILVTERVSKQGDPVTIGMLQLGTMGVLSLIVACITGTFSLPAKGVDWAMIMMLVLVCSCFGFTFQPVAQRVLPAETAAMFSVINPLTTSLLGIIAAGEDLGIMKVIGYLCILAAMIIYNMNSVRKDG